MVICFSFHAKAISHAVLFVGRREANNISLYQLLHTVNCVEGIGLPHCAATKKRATIAIVQSASSYLVFMEYFLNMKITFKAVCFQLCLLRLSIVYNIGGVNPPLTL